MSVLFDVMSTITVSQKGTPVIAQVAAVLLISEFVTQQRWCRDHPQPLLGYALVHNHDNCDGGMYACKQPKPASSKPLPNPVAAIPYLCSLRRCSQTFPGNPPEERPPPLKAAGGQSFVRTHARAVVQGVGLLLSCCPGSIADQAGSAGF